MNKIENKIDIRDNTKKLEEIKKIASLDIGDDKNKIKLEKIYKKIPIYQKLIEKNKDPENVEFLLSIILSANRAGKNKKAKISYIYVNDYLSTTIIDKNSNYVCTVYGLTLIEILKKSLIILHLIKKEEEECKEKK